MTTKELFDLTDKVAIVTGGRGLYGASISEGLCEAGAIVIIASRNGAKCEESTLATCGYGAPLTAAVGRGNVFGCQFHPEKSGKVGLSILKAFCEV